MLTSGRKSLCSEHDSAIQRIAEQLALPITEQAGVTVVTITCLYESKEAREVVSRSGIEHGMAVGYSRLEELLAELGGNPASTDHQTLRHMLATLAYRGGKAVRNAPAGFGGFQPEGCMNTPAMLLAHIGDLIEWAHAWSQGDATFRVSAPVEWDAAVNRFHDTLGRFDAYLAAGGALGVPLHTLFQAPIADALTHIGQLALLRRMAGDPVLGESYRVAEIVAGRTGPDQAKAVREFEKDKGAIWRGKQS